MPTLRGGCLTSLSVLENLGAGAGCLIPATSIKVFLSTLCLLFKDSSRERTGAKQTSLPVKISHHSSLLFFLKRSLIMSFNNGNQFKPAGFEICYMLKKKKFLPIFF